MTRSAPRSRSSSRTRRPDLRYDALHQIAGVLARVGFANPFANEPRRSSWTAERMDALLSRHDFRVVRDDDLLTIAERMGIAITAKRSVRAGRIVIADR